MKSRLPCLLVLLNLCLGIWALGVTGAVAQDSAPTAGSAPTSTVEAAAAFPAGLGAPDIPLQELSLRVIPLSVDELTALADAWFEIVKQQTTQVIDLQVGIGAMDGSQANAARDRLTQLAEKRGESLARYTVVLNNLDKKGGDEAAVARYRAYRNAILFDEKQNADWQTLYKQSEAWATSPEGGVRLGIRLAVIVGSFLALLLIARTFRQIASRFLARVPDLSKLLQGFIAMAIYWIAIAFGLMVVLSSLGIDVTPVFALVGGASFIMAFAFQETLSNLAAGLMIMINRPFDEGDYVTVAGTGGTVKSVSIVSTKVTTPDNQVIIIPNSKVWGDVITNVTASATRRIDLVFSIGYGDSIAEAQKILEDLVAAHPLVLKDPAPTIRVDELADSSVNFICRPWSTSADYWTVKWDLTRQVKEAFDAAGISIPYPQTDFRVHMKPGAAPFPPAETTAAPAALPIPASRTAEALAQGEDGAGEAGQKGS